MKMHTKSVLGLAIAVGVLMSPMVTFAQSADAEGIQLLRDESSPYRLRASDLLGMDVINRNGEEIGEIDDLDVPGPVTETG